MGSPDVVVIGGGLHGCATALHCARAGLQVELLEREAVGRHASGVNAGGVRQLGRHYSEVPLSVLAMQMWRSIGDLVDDDCGFQPSGQIKVAGTEAHMEANRARVARLQTMGFAHEEVIGADELRALLPALSDGHPGALISRQDGFANPYRTTTAFRRKAQSLGVRIHEGRAATALTRDGAREGGGFRIDTAQGPLRAARVVNCAGAWAGTICAAMGEPVPIRAAAPMMTITAPMAPFVSPVVGFSGAPLSFKQFANGTVMIGGGYSGEADLDTGLTRLRHDRLAVNLRTAMDLFPVMAGARIVRHWAGVEGEMPDAIPVIGPSSTTEGLFHAFGFSAHGFQLGPVVGLLIADLIQQGRSRLNLADFAISRFRTQDET
ncbi:FAD-dependent oxidoreductase [Szabonella alba]|uniref:FAD-binding oxidoreductase n=1 Tax=Szabonella alba TaxID=2804194 RepID=A0A8K0V9P6_9RHOB|nr:FAD-binding oxidoreductase [Szabonella alba]